jgi:hypothetical protein
MSLVSRWQRLTRVWRSAAKRPFPGPERLDPALLAALAPLGLPDPSSDEACSNQWLACSAKLTEAAFKTRSMITIGLIVVILHLAAFRYVLLPVGAAG